MLASRGLREDDEGKISRMAQEFDVAVKRQARKVMLQTAIAATALLAGSLLVASI